MHQAAHLPLFFQYPLECARLTDAVDYLTVGRQQALALQADLLFCLSHRLHGEGSSTPDGAMSARNGAHRFPAGDLDNARCIDAQ
jgi:hypothetical protein